MKKVKKLPVFCIAALLLLLITSFIGVICSNNTASADTSEGENSSYVQALDAVWDIQSNREIHVTEKMTVSFN